MSAFADTAQIHTETRFGLHIRYQQLATGSADPYHDTELAPVAAIFCGRDHHWLGIGSSDAPQDVVDAVFDDEPTCLAHRIMAELFGVAWSVLMLGPLETFEHQMQATAALPERYRLVTEESLELARKTDVAMSPLTDPRKRVMLLATLERPGLRCLN